jgi:hypothetical protein
MDTRFDCLVDFTCGRPVVCGDHKWVPVAHGVIAHTYRDRVPVEIDILEAAKTAGTVLARHAAANAVWGSCDV